MVAVSCGLGFDIGLAGDVGEGTLILGSAARASSLAAMDGASPTGELG